MKHSANDSFGWDWFMETTQSGNHYIQTAVIIIYNTNKEDWGGPKYGREVQRFGRTREFSEDAGGFSPGRELQYNPSKRMKEFILGAKDYHCGGCLSAPTVFDKYKNFILSPAPSPYPNPFQFMEPPSKVNRLKATTGIHN